MAGLKSLVKDTALYGLSSMVGRFLNYLLVPLYTAVLPAASGGYGVVTNVYAWAGLIMVLLTFGMETGFFRFANKSEEDPVKVYANSLISVGGISLIFAILCLTFLQPVSNLLEYGDHPDFIGMMIIVMALDAFLCIPFAYLRFKKRPIKFVAIKFVSIIANIVLNLFFLLLCPWLHEHFPAWVDWFYNPTYLVGLVQLGIYGAATKIAMVMAMFTQAFRYAYEPFVFGKQKEGDNRRMYAQAMKYFLIFAMFAFLVVMFYLDLLRYMVAPDYWAGLSVVAIVIGAEIFKGIYFNLSFWYKLIDETRWGAYFSIVGCVIIVGMNVMLVPTYGFVASAWASVAGYAVITILSYWIGQKKYPIHYDLKHLGTYVLFTAVLYVIGEWVPIENIVLRLAFRTALLLIFMAYVVRKDLPLSQIPVINRIIKKK